MRLSGKVPDQRKEKGEKSTASKRLCTRRGSQKKKEKQNELPREKELTQKGKKRRDLFISDGPREAEKKNVTGLSEKEKKGRKSSRRKKLRELIRGTGHGEGAQRKPGDGGKRGRALLGIALGRRRRQVPRSFCYEG